MDIAALGTVAAIAGIAAFAWAAIFGGRGLTDFLIAAGSRLLLWTKAKKLERRREVKRYVERVQRESAVIGGASTAVDEKQAAAGVSPHFPLKLEDVYVPTTTLASPSDRSSDLIVSPQTGLLIRVETRSTPIMPIFERSRILAVLGPGGSGKTTLLRHLFLRATEGRSSKRSVHHKKTPLFISCVQAMKYIGAANGGLENIAVAVSRFETFVFVEIFGEEPTLDDIDALRNAFHRGRFLVLFDGLDEILGITARAWFVRVIERLNANYAACSFVITCRPAAYTGHARIGADVVVTEIAPLNLADISRYIESYSNSLGSDATAGEQLRARRLRALRLVHELNLNPTLAALVQNPLNLTILCHHAFVSGQDRIDYAAFLDACTLSLLGRWDLSKSLALADFTNAAAVLEERSPHFRRAIVEIVSHRYFVRNLPYLSEDELVACVEAEIPGLREAEGVQSDVRITARQLIRILVLHGGILDEAGDRNYAFQSPVIRDYLVARFLVRTLKPDELAAFVRNGLNDVSRHGIAVLAVEHLSRQSPEHLGTVFSALEAEWSSQGISDRSLPMVEGLFATVEFTALGSTLFEALEHALLGEIAAGTTAPAKRARIGAAAALRGLYRVTPRFVGVVGGVIPIGGSHDGASGHVVTVEPFEIGDYLVTNTEYEEFVRDGGYLDRSYWTRAGWSWRTERSIEQPFFWDVPLLRNALQPVVGVSWYEAYAYCAWRRVRLPTEVEWEFVAGGPTHTDFPWGQEPAPSRCNVVESKIGYPTVVGLFRTHGDCSPADLVGNVWEWTSSAYLPSPYAQLDAREGCEGESARVMKGGSWFSTHRQAASSYRRWLHPGARQPNFGFRVARSGAANAGN